MDDKHPLMKVRDYPRGDVPCPHCGCHASWQIKNMLREGWYRECVICRYIFERKEALEW